MKAIPTKSLLCFFFLVDDVDDVVKCNLGKVNLESMRPAVLSTNIHAGWPQGFVWPCADESAICSFFAIMAVCSTLFRQQIYYPGLPTHVESQNKVKYYVR